MPWKLKLNDASLVYEPETSEALGFGFRCGFLGLLHMEIIQERLEREYGLNLITTPQRCLPGDYHCRETLEIENPSKLPPVGKLAYIENPLSKPRSWHRRIT